MENLARGHWSAQQIKDALHGRTGSREIHFRGDVIRNGAKLKEITLGRGSSVAMDATAEIMQTGRFVLYEELDWLIDQIKPYMLLRMEDAITVSSFVFASWNQRDALKWSWDQWDAKGYTWDQLDAGQVDETTVTPRYAEFALGVYIPSTPLPSRTDGIRIIEVEGYDRTVILREDCLDTPLYMAGDSLYLDQVQAVLVSAGITNVLFYDYITTALPAGREFEIGTSKLEIVNTLLSEINYEKIRCDADGNFIVEAKKIPSPSKIDYTYAANEMSVMSADVSTELDLYNVPNVFVGICSNPDLDQDYYSVYVNDNPISKLSTVRRGRRIVAIYQFDQIASQEDLDAAIALKAFEANQVEETIIFYSALMPIHGHKDTLALEHPDAQGTVVQSKWEIPLEVGGRMTHTTERLVIV